MKYQKSVKVASVYKHASRGLQRAHRVDKPMPTGGYIGAESDDGDFIATAANATLDFCIRERQQLGLEITKAQAELAAAKKTHASQHTISEIGLKLQVLVQRKSLFNDRYKKLMSDDQGRRMNDAVKALCDPDLAQRIYDYANGKTDVP